VTDAGAVKRLVQACRPDAVIHAQALSNVDACEHDPETAYLQNVQPVKYLCRALQDTPAWLLLVSTDYVFDGRKQAPYTEADAPNPLSVYGRTKLAAEEQALRYPRARVVRPSTLFGVGRMNFCQAVAMALSQGQSILALRDQTTSPTYTQDLAEGIEAVIQAIRRAPDASAPRIYHITNAGACTRVEFATHIAAQLGYSPSLIRPVTRQELGFDAPRPAWSALVSDHFTSLTRRTIRPWYDAVNEYLAQHPWSN